MKAILIDDEHLALTYLEYQLNMIGEIEIIGKYTNPLEGRQAVEQLDVDIVFLDIQIPKINGLELAEILLEQKPYLHIVFITTYDEYAIKAFKLNALDYVLKPVELERLKLTIKRTKQHKSRLDEPQEAIKKWEIRTFGGFKIFDHRQKELQRFNWRTTKAQELFLYLLHYQGNPVSKAKLIELLWPNSDLQRAASQLYTTIYHIRKTLESLGGRIQLRNTPAGYLLSLENIYLDMNDFERFLQEEPPLQEETAAEYERVLHLFRGEYLEEADYIWAEYDRQRYQLQWIRLKLHLTNWLFEHGRYEEAYKHCENICGRYPLEETAHFLYMQICDKLGLDFLVRKQYQMLDILMQKEFGEKPSPEIMKWYQHWEQDTL